jgi:hypothetical protein
MIGKGKVLYEVSEVFDDDSLANLLHVEIDMYEGIHEMPENNIRLIKAVLFGKEIFRILEFEYATIVSI